MSNRRMISSELFEDSKISELSFAHRLLWVGLITACADDQGRFLAQAAIIRSKVFPYDDIPLKDIQDGLERLTAAGAVIVYQDGTNKIGQIKNWWRYQSPSWACASRYPAPDGWVDREKYHAAGNKIITTNWDMQGGYNALPTGQDNELSSELPSPLPSGIEKRREEKINYNNNSAPPENQPKEEDEPVGILAPYQQAFTIATGLPVDFSPRQTQALKIIADMGAIPDDITEACSILADKDYQIVGVSSLVNAIKSIVAKRNAPPLQPRRPKRPKVEPRFTEEYR